YGLMFGPDVATSSRATFGGMIANNSSGARVQVYGLTSDHVVSIEAVLADGRVVTLGPGSAALEPERERLAKLVKAHAAQIRERMPPGLVKRWHGYALSRFLERPENLVELICGSEGTLAAVVSAEIKLVPLPRAKALGLVFFASVRDAMQAAAELLDLQPAAVEHVDRMLLDQAIGSPQFRPARELLELDTKPAESVLVIEFFGNASEVQDKLAALESKRLGLRTRLVPDPAQQEMIWALRKYGLSLLTSCPGKAKPLEGIADLAVRPAELCEYVAGLQKVLAKHGLRASFYGHVGGGLLHVRPVIALHEPGGPEMYRALVAEVSELLRQFKGSLAGEHGLGLSRAEFLEAHLGPELMAVLREIKRTFDPANVLNPGKVLSDGQHRIDRDLRTHLVRELPLPFEPVLKFAQRDGSFSANLDQCNGCGACVKETPSMCPTYIATHDEAMSTRGRANIIRAALELRGLEHCEPLRAYELESVLGSCLSCKACAVECPSNVDMALLKAELLNARRVHYGLGLRGWVFSRPDLLGRLGCLAPGIANRLLEQDWARRMIGKVLGLAPNRPLPKYATERFDRWFAKRPEGNGAARSKVILWDDTFVRYHEPHIGKAAVRVLEAAGFDVVLPEGRKCCGRPAFSQGDLDRARRLGQHNLTLLREMLGLGRPNRRAGRAGLNPDTPVVFLEPSCWAMFAQDYRELGLPGADEVARRCVMFEQFIAELLRSAPGTLRFTEKSVPVAIHVHCHAKALAGAGVSLELARRVPGAQVRLLEAGCCGMAGAFGMLESKYALSVKVAEALVAQISQLPSEAVLIVSGTSCRQQIAHLTGRRPVHMAEFLAGALAQS
ncbi:MAG: FAD-binding protein, partial [Verrucomicrobiae bacterium]|nr:FAD-binding protein [Verrucomicrobiae bacterium]